MARDGVAGAGAALRSAWPEAAGDATETLQAQASKAIAANVSSRARRRGLPPASVKRRGHGARQETEIRIDSPAIALLTAGAGPHRIRPRRAQALHLAVGASESLVAAVRHPGFAPDPIVARAFAESDEDIDQAIDRAGSELVAELARRVEG